MHYSGEFVFILLILSVATYTAWTIALVLLFRTVRPIGNCYVIKKFSPDNRIYAKTTAKLKYLYGKYLLNYIVDGREFSVKIPYHIQQETINVIYMKSSPHKVIADDPEFYHKVIVKNLITSAIIFISSILINKIIFGSIK